MTDQTPKPKKPKQPQDHKPKQEKKSETTTLHAGGRDWIVANETLDDFEFLADLGGIEDGNPTRIPRALQRLLDREQYAEAMNMLRDPDSGRVSVEAGAEFFRELFEQTAG